MTSRLATFSALERDALRLKVSGGACGECASAGCGSRLLNHRDAPAELVVPLEAVGAFLPSGLVNGESLRIAIAPRKLVAISLAVFLLPILLMLLSCVTCSALLSPDNGSMTLAALVGLLAGGRLAATVVKRIIAGEDRALLNIARASG